VTYRLEGKMQLRKSTMMRGIATSVPLLALTALMLSACSSGPKPILYPNEQLKVAGQAQADQDIAECRAVADSAGAS
jgi:starvation-inducible outer membrane lipoprotein